ncbi:MAG: hypothetical protein IKB50_01570 [Clostridia bacterium]|nr:hypothetical protein [Clostridia bacterium]
MKTFAKRLLCALLAGVMVFGLMACSKDDKSSSSVPNDPDLERLVREEGDDFVEGFESGFEGSSGGLDCECSIRVEGTSLIVDCLILDVDNVPAETKEDMQKSYDSSKDSMKATFEPFKEEAPNLTLVVLNICEEDGDLLASVNLYY